MIGLNNNEIETITSFRLSKNVLDWVNNIDYNFENCGALIGLIDNNRVFIESISVIKNSSDKQKEFLINIEELHSINIPKSKRLLGIFHNHPYGHNEEPSFIDKHYQSLFPILWMITSKIEQQLYFSMSINNKKLLIDEYCLE